MRGGLKLSERGVIPRLLSAVYRRGRKVAKDSHNETQVSVTLSYYEIYNDKVFDLFEPPSARTPSGLPLREAAGGKTVVVGLSERACGDLKDFEKLYIEANNNRSTAGTKLNAQSSRSHAILMVKVSQTTGDQVRVSTASAIDLAGSEDNRRTENGKERMIESASINKSLFVLSQCIDAIGRGDKRIPYRESKMTRILSLGQNNGITIMILNLAPLRSYHLDTLSSLNVSSRAKRIEVREIENEIVYKQPPRTNTASIGGVGMTRQPLRPLANVHNAHVNAAAAAEQKAGAEKPLKAFSVYSDKSKARLSNATSHGVNKSTSIKRPSDAGHAARPSKISRPNPATRAPDALSAASIEAIVQRKVSEILAAQAASLPPPAAPAVPDSISAAVQARLEALERKIEAGTGKGEKEDARNEGLRFLLMAKQHKERGEDASALKCYELAEPFFPAQEKLKRKMEVLREKIRAKREAQNCQAQLPTPANSFNEVVAGELEDVFVDAASKPARRRVRSEEASDDEYHAVSPAHSVRADEDDSFVFKPVVIKPRKTKAAGTLRVFDDQEAQGPPTPRTRYLLDVVNSRDEALIRGLSGFGAKKAKDLVAWLEERGEEGNAIASLVALKGVPGMGGKTIERALGGVVLGA